MGGEINILKIRNREHVSRKNFGGSVARKRGESNFIRKFERAFFQRVKKGVALDEFAVPQHGVADLLWVGWSHAESEFSAIALERQLKRRKLYAFEAKLSNWQAALHQAYRYRYYADKAIVVMPLENIVAAVRNLDAFREAKVGLWSFCAETNRIKEWYTPTKVKALSLKSRAAAIRKLSSKLNLT